MFQTCGSNLPTSGLFYTVHRVTSDNKETHLVSVQNYDALKTHKIISYLLYTMWDINVCRTHKSNLVKRFPQSDLYNENR